MLALARKLYWKITEPRHVKVVYFFFYLLAVVAGILSFLFTPHSVSGMLGPVLSGVWASLFLVGGLAGAVSVLPGWWWAERLLGISLIGMGLAVYLSVAVMAHFELWAEVGISRLTSVAIICMASMPLILRFLFIREYSFEPRPRR